MQSMKAIVKARPEYGAVEMITRPVPEPGFGEVLLKNKAVSICGTDVHIYKWDAWSQAHVKPPAIIGHEFAAEVAAVGPGVSHVKVGDYVSGEGHLVCGFCSNCRTGNGHVCLSWKGIGYDVDGAFAEYFVMPERNIWHNDPDLPPEFGAIQDPLGNATHAVFRADCVTKNVAVFGCGPVGLLAVAVLKAIGAAQIFAVEHGNQYRMDLAKKVGATYVINAADTDVVKFIKDHTGGAGVDVAIEISGAQQAIGNAIDAVRMAGDVVLLGTPVEPTAINLASKVVFRAISLHGITGRRVWDTWFRMKGLLKSGTLDVAPIITHSFPFDEFQKGFDVMMSGQCGKVVLTF